jgi:hypothetical protein
LPGKPESYDFQFAFEIVSSFEITELQSSTHLFDFKGTKITFSVLTALREVSQRLDRISLSFGCCTRYKGRRNPIFAFQSRNPNGDHALQSRARQLYRHSFPSYGKRYSHLG